jgi:hypothetical protein
MFLHAVLAAAAEAAAGGGEVAAAAAAGATGAASATASAAAAAGTPTTPGIWWPLLLSTFAGLSTSLGALIAINLSPNEATLAFLLGSAIGVMGTVSVAELWVHKAIEHSNWVGVTAALLVGGAVFALLDPLLPKSLGEGGQHVQDAGARGGGGQQVRRVLVAGWGVWQQRGMRVVVRCAVCTAHVVRTQPPTNHHSTRCVCNRRTGVTWSAWTASRS